MNNPKIAEIQRVFTTRLEALEHVLAIGEQHFPDPAAFMDGRLADDMLPFAAQIALACNSPRGFAQWCAGQPVENLPIAAVGSIEQARAAVAETKALVAGIRADDAKLEESKRVGLGPGLYCELPAHQYVADYLLPNLYFHVTIAYAILRMLGAPLGKADDLCVLAPHVRQDITS